MFDQFDHLRRGLRPQKVALFRRLLVSDLRLLEDTRSALGDRVASIDMRRFRRSSIADTGGFIRFLRFVVYSLLAMVTPLFLIFLTTLALLAFGPDELRKGNVSSFEVAPMAAGALVVIGGISILLARSVLGRLFARLRYHKCLESTIALRYLTLLKAVSTETSFKTVRTRRSLVRDLDELAGLLQTEMPRALALRRGSKVREVSSDHYVAAATFVRELQTWVTVPQGDTWHHLRNELATGFWCAWEGRWHDLPQRELPRASRTPFIQALTSAILPLAIITILHLLGLGVGGVVESWAFLFAAAWALLKLVSLVDPTYSSRVAELREIMGILREAPKGSEK